MSVWPSPPQKPIKNHPTSGGESFGDPSPISWAHVPTEALGLTSQLSVWSFRRIQDGCSLSQWLNLKVWVIFVWGL